MYDAHENPLRAVGSSMNSNQITSRDNYGRGNGERMMYQNGGVRILPPPMIHGKSISTQLASSSEAIYRTGVGEERPPENDERLIYQAALEVLLLLMNLSSCYQYL